MRLPPTNPALVNPAAAVLLQEARLIPGHRALHSTTHDGMRSTKGSSLHGRSIPNSPLLNAPSEEPPPPYRLRPISGKWTLTMLAIGPQRPPVLCGGGVSERIFMSNRFFNLSMARWVIIYNLRGNSNDGPNQTAEALLLLLLEI